MGEGDEGAEGTWRDDDSELLRRDHDRLFPLRTLPPRLAHTRSHITVTCTASPGLERRTNNMSGESRTELLAWLNDLLQLSYTKVEQVGQSLIPSRPRRRRPRPCGDPKLTCWIILFLCCSQARERRTARSWTASMETSQWRASSSPPSQSRPAPCTDTNGVH